MEKLRSLNSHLGYKSLRSHSAEEFCTALALGLLLKSNTAVDDLATQGARASAGMVSACFSQMFNQIIHSFLPSHFRANPTRKPLSAGAVRQDPQRPDPLINGHGANTDTCDSSEDAGPIFTNVPSAWEAESSASRPGTGASARPETRNISPQDIVSSVVY